MPEGLKIQVGADVQQAVKALSQDIPKAADKAGAALSNLQHDADKSSKVFSRSLPQSVTKSRAAVLQIQAPLSKLGDTLETLRGKLGAKQSFLNVEKDAGKIAILNKEIAALNLEISRVGNIGKAGFDNLGVSIQKIPPELNKVASGAGKAFSVLRQAAFILPGIGIAGLISGLGELVVGLFDAGKSFSATEIRAGHFDNMMKDVKESVDSLKNSLDFEGKVKKLQLELSGLTGNKLSIAKGGIDISQSGKSLPLIDSKIKQLTESNRLLVEGFLKTNQAVNSIGAKGSGLVLLVKQFGTIEKIPNALADNLSKADKELLREYQATNTELKALQKNRIGILQDVGLAGIQIALDAQKEVADVAKENAEKQKQAAEEARAAYQKYVSDTIARAKKLSDFFKDGIDLKLTFSIFDNTKDEFRKSLAFLKNFDAGNFNYTLVPNKISLKDVEFPQKEVAPIATEFGAMFYSELKDYFKNTPFDLSIDIAVKEEAQKKAIGQLFGIGSDSILTKIQKEAVFAAQAINEVLQPAFKGLFDAILAGENPLKAFFTSLGNAVAQLVQKLISAAITAAILSAIFPAGVGGAKGFGSIFGKILGFAAGGLVTGPQLALIGEGSGTSKANPEVVAPLDKLKGMLTGMGGGSQVVVMRTIVRGNNLALVQARTSRSQKRTTGR